MNEAMITFSRPRCRAEADIISYARVTFDAMGLSGIPRYQHGSSREDGSYIGISNTDSQVASCWNDPLQQTCAAGQT